MSRYINMPMKLHLALLRVGYADNLNGRVRVVGISAARRNLRSHGWVPAWILPWNKNRRPSK